MGGIGDKTTIVSDADAINRQSICLVMHFTFLFPVCAALFLSVQKQKQRFESYNT